MRLGSNASNNELLLMPHKSGNAMLEAVRLSVIRSYLNSRLAYRRQVNNLGS